MRTALLMIGVMIFLGAGCQSLPDYTAPPAMDYTELFVAGQEGYHCYRIPALIVAPNGDLLAMCEGRKTKCADHGDIDLVMKRSEDGGQTWTGLEMIYEEGDTEAITIGNPCPVVDESTGIIWLPFCRDNDRVLMTKSEDNGKTWAEPVDITESVKGDWEGWYATGPGVGIQLKHGPHKGRMVIPCDHRATILDTKKTCFSHAFYSDDHGASWQLGESVGPHTDECQVIERSDGSLLINMRNYWERNGKIKEMGSMRAIAWSTDGGATWSETHFDETLIEPVCQASIISAPRKMGEPNLVLFSNPAHKNKRKDMTVRLSYDEGKSWPVSRKLSEEPAAYSSLTALPDGSFACFYERGKKKPYETITFARFSLSWLEEQ